MFNEIVIPDAWLACVQELMTSEMDRKCFWNRETVTKLDYDAEFLSFSSEVSISIEWQLRMLILLILLHTVHYLKKNVYRA